MQKKIIKNNYTLSLSYLDQYFHQTVRLTSEFKMNIDIKVLLFKIN